MQNKSEDTWLNSVKKQQPKRGLGKGELFLIIVFVGGIASTAYNVWHTQDAKHQAAIERQTQDTNQRLARQAEAKRAHAARQAAQAPGQQRDPVQHIEALCNRIQAAGASTCTFHGGLFSDPYLDVTFAGSAIEARALCLAAVARSRQSEPLFSGRRWQMKVFSPQGDGTRPLVTCNL